MKKWLAIALGGAGLMFLTIALVIGGTGAFNRLTTPPSDLQDPAHLAVEPPIAETPTAEAPGLQPADAAPVPVVYGADVDLDAVQYPDDMQGSELDNAREWMQTQAITAQCMSEKGFDYTFSPFWSFSVNPERWPLNLPEDQQAAAREALDGPSDRGLGEDYRWEDAGCWGYAVHVMGNDDAH